MTPVRKTRAAVMAAVTAAVLSSLPVAAQGPVIFLIGDSTMADKPLTPGNPERGWGQILPIYFKQGVRVDNHAKNGRSSKSFRDEGLWKAVYERIQPGDFVIIQFAHNDEKLEDPKRYAGPSAAFKKNLMQYVRDVRERKGKPILATPIARRAFNADGTPRNTHGDYPAAVRQVAEEENVPLLDLTARSEELLKKLGPELSKKLFMWVDPGETDLIPEGRKDDTHLNPYGASRICDLAVMEIRRAVPELAAWLAAPAQQTPKYVDWVRPLTDTHKSRWFFFSSACRPFGMVNLSPDTKVEGDWDAGYLYDEPFIRSFSHIHGWQLAGIPVMPIVGQMNGNQGYEAYKSKFSHASEVVKPGYHKVKLDNYGATVELTSTKRAGFHRYSFPATEDAYVLFDAGAPLAMMTMQDASIRRINGKQLAGYSVMAPTQRRPKPVTVYFVAQFDREMSEFGGWEKGVVRRGAEGVSGARSGGYARFKFTRPGRLLMKVGISYVSEEQAARNLSGELSGWDFDAVVRGSFEEWDQWLGKIEVQGGTDQQKQKFYTDLWHALLGRRTFSDLDGSYVDNTGDQPKVRKAPPTRSTYNSDAFWGSQWNLNILWSMAYPKLMSEMVDSLVDYYKNGGMIARGPSGGNYTFVMAGDQAVPLIAAAYNKGIRDFDVKAAWEGSRKNAFAGGIRDHAGYEHGANAQGGGMKFYEERGYVPLGVGGKGMHREGAAQTLEYAYQDWCLAQFAKALGKTEDSAAFLKRSGNWRNLLDESTGWIRPKNMDGSWYEPFEPVCDGSRCRGFIEANAAIYTYYVQQDMPGLIRALGGPQKFIEKLTRQFELAAPARFVTPHGKHGENWVDYENQPSCHMAHLFSYAGAPWLTQYWVRRVKQETFGDTSPQGGYNGDEDQGQMGGLGVLMAIGLFDIQGGANIEPRYEITSPIFDRITIRLDPRYYPGKTFTVVTRDNRPGNVYIQSATLNGKPLNDRFWITHREFSAGGTLEIRLGPEPNKQWGVR